MRLVQFTTAAGDRRVGLVSEDGRALHVVASDGYLRTLALDAHRRGTPLAELVRSTLTGETEVYDRPEAFAHPA